MNTLITMLLAAIPKVLLGLAAKLLTEKMVQKIAEEVIIYGLQKLTPLTTNTLDDQIAGQIIQAIQDKPQG